MSPLKIVVTPNYLIEHHLWDKYCVLHQTNPWAINEGLLESDKELKLTLEEANELGLEINLEVGVRE